MSRIGKKSISVPKEVQVSITSEKELIVKGPKGTLNLKLLPGIEVEIKDKKIDVRLDKKFKLSSAFHGLYRALVNNMVKGTHVGFKKSLKLIGVGFRAQVKGNKLDLQIGFSHPTEIAIPKDITVKVSNAVDIDIEGCDRQKVGQFAALVRAVRKPEPYKGKGIRYIDEYVRKKAGKAAKTAGAAAGK